MPKSIFSLLLLALACGPHAARGQATEAGAFSLPTLAPTARGAALGGAPIVVLGSDPGSFLNNPALLAEEDDGEVSFGYLDHLSSLRMGTLTYARSVPRIGMMAAGIRYLGWGSIPRTDGSGVEDGSFRAGELAVSVTGSRRYGKRVRYGVTLGMLRSAIDGRSTTALAADAGVIVRWDEHRFAASASVHQAGIVFGSIGSTDDSLPVDVRIGIAKRLEHLPLLLTLTAYGLAGADSGDDPSGIVDRAFRHLMAGVEFQFSDAFQIRFGYDHRRHAALKTKTRLDVAGLSLGAGLRFRRISIDYAWTSWSSLGSLNRFTVATRL